MIEVEEKAAHILVVHLATPVSFLLRYDLQQQASAHMRHVANIRPHLSTVLADEVILVCPVLDEYPPARHVGRCEE